MGAGWRVRQQVGVQGRMQHRSKACVASDNPAMYLWGLVKQGACSRVVAQHECTLCTMRVRLAETEEYLLQRQGRSQGPLHLQAQQAQHAFEAGRD